MENQSTITQGLGIEDAWFDKKVDEVIQIWKKNTLVSEALEEICQEVKNEEFETQIPVTEYEKKLILIGYMVGQASSIMESERTERLKGVLAMMTKMLEEDSRESTEEDGK